MGLCNTFGFPFYSSEKLNPYGAIPPELGEFFEGEPTDEFPEGEPTDEDRRELRTGERFEIVTVAEDAVVIPGDDEEDGDEDDEVRRYVKIKKNLPCSGFVLELMFRTSLQSNNERAVDTGVLGVLAGGIGTQALGLQRFGGSIASGTNRFAIHACDSVMRFDVAVTITDKLLATQQEVDGENVIEYRLPSGQFLSVLGVFDEKIELTDEQLLSIGDHNRVLRGGMTGPMTGDGFSTVDLREQLFPGIDDFESLAKFQRTKPISWYQARRSDFSPSATTPMVEGIRLVYKLCQSKRPNVGNLLHIC